jgi:hypothetical protein
VGAFDPDALLRRLGWAPTDVTALLGSPPDRDARWRPADDAWSVVEIVWHLVGEEFEDSRARPLDAQRPRVAQDPDVSLK